VTYILGLNAYHGDSSACLVADGVLVAAAEEERFRRIKHWAGFPSEAVHNCLAQARIRLGDVDIIAINQDSRANLWKKIAYMAVHRPDLSLIFDRIRNKRERAGVAEELARAFPGEELRAQIREVEHHLAHLGSAFLVSPFEDAVVVSVDGFGDFASAAWGRGVGTQIDVEDKVYFPHSLGMFYQAMTQWLGFPDYGDEYKVMGLAPYGQPRFMDEMRRVVLLQDDGSFRLNLEFFRHHKENVDYEWESGQPKIGTLFSKQLEELLGAARTQTQVLTEFHRDVARSTQAMYEEAFFHLLNRLHERYRLCNVALAGGCAMNSVANGKVYRNTPFERVYVQSAAGDAGGAIGAAFVVSHALMQQTQSAGYSKRRKFVMDHAYWGPEFAVSDIQTLLAEKRTEINEAGCTVESVADEQLLCDQTAEALAQGKVVGWFQGRMEWGPRALGNRSILGDPRRTDMKELLNLKIKRRESFRPFAPSVLREHVAEWFETDDDVPFMMQVYQVKQAKRIVIPAVTHVDGSGRLQTVSRETNPRYHKLIGTFNAITGVPMLLNTSFNENEPIVCRPVEALDCFLRTRMDLLVLGNFLVSRQT
jgi:carbamoyltransferase